MFLTPDAGICTDVHFPNRLEFIFTRNPVKLFYQMSKIILPKRVRIDYTDEPPSWLFALVLPSNVAYKQNYKRSLTTSFTAKLNVVCSGSAVKAT